MARVARAHGALIVDKPRGWTSHDVVAKARSLYGQRRVGHGGTLDPLATGVLVLLLGEATKLSPYVSGANKIYEATLSFGVSTDTLDAEGEATASSTLVNGWCQPRAIEYALGGELTRTEQIPPAFSAIKVQGQTAHSLARRGKAPILEARPVRVESLEVIACTDEWARIRLSVSKGYYVRSFARDLCQRLGVEGHLSALVRIQSGNFQLADAHAWPTTTPLPFLALPDVARACLPAGVLNTDGATRAVHGKELLDEHFDQLPGSGPVGAPAAWFAPTGRLLAIGARTESGSFRVLRGFAEA